MFAPTNQLDMILVRLGKTLDELRDLQRKNANDASRFSIERQQAEIAEQNALRQAREAEDIAIEVECLIGKIVNKPEVTIKQEEEYASQY